ncbi:MAG TPA: SPFH domain-containing protein, partial [Chitinophagaceae bacterium]|nr:SPFH domain-containing protein [Chitinophagaceae bacterium]
MEKIIKPMSGYLALLLALVSLAAFLYFISNIPTEGDAFIGYAVLCFMLFLFLSMGIIIISPNYSRVLTFFGKYVGTVKVNGLLFVNPLYKKQKISLRAENLESSRLKVNDKMGNPIEIAAVIVWRVQNTFRAAFDVADYTHYVKVQSEAAVRHLATTFPYDQMEDVTAEITLRDGGEKVNELLEKELNERLAP